MENLVYNRQGEFSTQEGCKTRRCLALILMTMLLASMISPAMAEKIPYTLAGLEATVTTRSKDPLHDWETNLFFRHMEEKTGVSFSMTEYTDPSAWRMAKAAMLSGDTVMPDVFFKADLTPQETMAFYEAGKLMDLKPYLAEYAPNLWALLENNPEWLEAVTLPDGAIVALPAINELRGNNAAWINTTWLEKIGMPMPTTAEELTEVLRAFRDRDVNGNGNYHDEIPLSFSSMWDLRFLGHAFGMNADDYGLTMKDGQVSEVLTSAENRAFLTWLHQLWEEELLDPDGFSGLRLLVDRDSESEEPAKYGVVFGVTPQDVVGGAWGSEYALLDPLVYEGTQIYRDFTGDLYRGTFAISSTCDAPETLLKWVDFLYTDEGFMLTNVGEEGQDYEWNDDGTWMYAYPAAEITSKEATNTIFSGTYMPGLVSVKAQTSIDSSESQRIAREVARLRQWEKRPLPLTWMSEAQVSRVAELQRDIGPYAERQMVWFVVGDVPLTDESWAEFCTTVREKGMDELVSIWQTACDTAR